MTVRPKLIVNFKDWFLGLMFFVLHFMRDSYFLNIVNMDIEI